MSRNFNSRSFRVILVLLFCLYQLQSFGQDSTLLSNNKKVIIKYIDVVINGHNLNKKDEFFHADYIWHTMDGKQINHKQDSGHIVILRWLLNAIPDVHYTIDNIEAGGEMVGISTTATGIARSEMFGLPAGQKKVQYKQMFFYRLKDGKITDQWEVVDADNITAQIKQK